MQTRYFQVFVSAEDEEQANKILTALLKKKLVTGGPVLQGPAKFWWKGEIVKMDYCMISTYTIANHKQAIIDEVKKASIEEVPMIVFLPMDGNSELLQWIDETIGSL